MDAHRHAIQGHSSPICEVTNGDREGVSAQWLAAPAYLAAVILYVLIALVAAAPRIVADLRVLAQPLARGGGPAHHRCVPRGERRLAAAV
jgi:hypothetical protein